MPIANVPEIFVPEAALCWMGWELETAAVGETFLHPIPGMNVASSAGLMDEAEGDMVLLPLPVYEAETVLSDPEPSQLELDSTEEEEAIGDQLCVLTDEPVPENVTVRVEVTKVTEGAGTEEVEGLLLGSPDAVGKGTGAELLPGFSWFVTAGEDKVNVVILGKCEIVAHKVVLLGTILIVGPSLPEIVSVTETVFSVERVTVEASTETVVVTSSA
jgi:hypothetical protein